LDIQSTSDEDEAVTDLNDALVGVGRIDKPPQQPILYNKTDRVYLHTPLDSGACILEIETTS